MNLSNLLSGLGKADTYDLYQWILFLATKPPCKICVDLKKNAGRLPDCCKCVPSKKLIAKAKTHIQEEMEYYHGTYPQEK